MSTPIPPEGQPGGTIWQDGPQGAPQTPPGHTGQQGWGPQHPAAPPVPTPPPPPEPRKSWFRRHKILTALLVLVGLGVVGSAFSGQDETQEPTRAVSTPAADQGDAQQHAESAEVEPAEAPAEPASARADAEPAANQAPDQPQVGDPVRDGNFEFVVTDVETGLGSVGEGYSEEQAQGQFVLVHLSVTNIGDQAQTLFDNDQVLIDEQGREHSTSSASLWLDDGLWLDEINPGNSTRGVLLFDIPADAKPVSVELHDSMFSGGTTVDLP